MVRQDDEAAKRYILDREEAFIGPPYIGLIVESDEKPIGAFILNDFTRGHNIEMSAVIDGPISVSDFRNIFRYCFERVRRVTARTSVNNARTIYILEKFGFRREGLLREWFTDGSDGVLFSLLRSEQRIFR